MYLFTIEALDPIPAYKSSTLSIVYDSRDILDAFKKKEPGHHVEGIPFTGGPALERGGNRFLPLLYDIQTPLFKRIRS